MTNTDNRKFWRDYYKSLEGGRIVKTGVKDDGFPYLVVEKNGERFECDISADPEGNGPGFLFGLPTPKSPPTGAVAIASLGDED